MNTRRERYPSSIHFSFLLMVDTSSAMVFMTLDASSRLSAFTICFATSSILPALDFFRLLFSMTLFPSRCVGRGVPVEGEAHHVEHPSECAYFPIIEELRDGLLQPVRIDLLLNRLGSRDPAPQVHKAGGEHHHPCDENQHHPRSEVSEDELNVKYVPHRIHSVKISN